MVVIDSHSSATATATAAVAPGAGVLRASAGLALVTLIGFGLLYSLLAVGAGRLLFPDAATGSLVERDGRIVGSQLVAQPFAGDGWFQSRPSAAGYDLMALAGSNQARTNPDMRARAEAARAAVAAREGVAPAQVPGDLVTQSGGGIDPHLSPEAVRVQVARVARARGVDAAAIENMLQAHVEGPQFGLYGAERVNVLALNLAMDARYPLPVAR
jgi:potassium-transporting ATPase KdpC subunit